MRFVSLCVLVGAAATLAPTSSAQSPCPGQHVGQPPFNNTFSSATLTRGYFFQAPVDFTIDAVQVPDETAAGFQSAQIYLDNAPPPAFSATSNPPLVWDSYGQPSGALINTGGVNVAAGQWVVIIGACHDAAFTTMHNSYAPTGTFSTDIGGVPIDIDRCGTQNSIGTMQNALPIWSAVGSVPSRVHMCVTITGNVPPSLVGVSETVPFGGTLGSGGGVFRDGDFLRHNYDDSISGNANTGILSVTSWNFGTGGPPPTGVTAAVPGLIQTWAGSNPTGWVAYSGPFAIGAADNLLAIPANFFAEGDTFRLQSVFLNTNVPAGQLPVSVMFNSPSFSYTQCAYLENFDSTATGTTMPTGWTNTGTDLWRVHSGGTGSVGTGPTSAASLPNYIYTETSLAAGTHTFITDSPAIPSTSAPTNTLNFRLSRIGVAIGTLNVYVQDAAGGFQQIATYTGPDAGQAQNGIEWGLESIDMTQGGTITLGSNIVIRFEYNWGGTFTGDLAIDDFCFS